VPVIGPLGIDLFLSGPLEEPDVPECWSHSVSSRLCLQIEERLSKNKAEMIQEKTGAAEPPQIVFKK
jgi:hypothetical protein